MSVRVQAKPDGSTFKIHVARDFSRFPGGRYKKDGPYSGEAFREEMLVPALLEALKSNSVVEVELDGTAGYASSFLEEAFGGLVREGRAEPEAAKENLQIIATEPIYAPYQMLAVKYIDDACRMKKRS